ncbi:MAG TPA: tRNA (guanosine(46)-N7)-methyltransferase TrmB [Steroidobacteraceae bacterium]|nr:tRNA (guanosine(46)-N7)-methyltransferase TrmB [Steroidobacteraceae bacterium]
MIDRDTAQAPSAPQHRRVRSFVLRGGRMTDGQERAWRELWPRYGIDFNGSVLDLDKQFGRCAPRMLEIGFGTGDALLAYAQQHPDRDCLGIEVHRPGVGHLMLKAHEAQLCNVRVICHDAVEVLAQSLLAHSLDAVHIFFPDPWHKKRHHKRRLIQTSFVDLLAKTLRSDGVVLLATDWENYAEQMRTVMDAHPAFTSVAPHDPMLPSGFTARFEHRPLTRFERRGQRLGHKVWDLGYRCKKVS